MGKVWGDAPWETSFWVPGSGYWVLGTGFWILDSGFWIIVGNNTEVNGEVMENRLKNCIHRKVAKNAKGLFPVS